MSNIRSPYGVDAIPHLSGDGWAGSYWAPGLEPGLARRGSDNKVLAYSTPAGAKLAAADTLIHVLNHPRLRANKRQGRSERYDKLSGPEFAEKLKDTGLTLKLFTDIIGTKEQRALMWLDGFNAKGEEERLPHYAHVLLEIFKRMPEAIDIAEELTNNHTSDMRTKIHAPFTADQIATLQARQSDETSHPYTCPGDWSECADNRSLTVTAAGMVCPCGHFTQTWAWDRPQPKGAE